MRGWVRYSVVVISLLVMLQMLAIIFLQLFSRPETVDTNWSRQTIFQTDSKMVVYGSPIVAKTSNKPQVIILGSSNTTMGIRPERLAPYLSDIRVHNLSIGSERFRSYPQIVDLLFRQTPKSQRHNYIFVFGISYPLTLDWPSELLNLRTSVDDELQRFGLFYDSGDGSKSRVAEHYLSQALQSAWPFLVPKAFYNRLVRVLPEKYQFGLAEWFPYSEEESNTVIYTPDQNRARIAHYRAQTMDMTGHYNFDYLMRAVQQITDAGAQAVIVDLPSARWLKDATPHYEGYQKLRKPYLRALEKMPNVRYISIDDGFKDSDFYDGIHPRNRITPIIAKRIAPVIQEALKDAR